MTTYRQVQGLSRGLALLRAMNSAEREGATPARLSAATGLNRTTVKRLLETLVAEGCVRPCDADGCYGLAPEVLALSCGLSEDDVVLAQAGPVLKALCRATGWSLRLNTLRDDCVVIRDSTHDDSTLAREAWGGLRHRLPILLTAAGRACFASCGAEERSRIVQILRQRRDDQSALANDGRLVDLLTRRVLGDGYALNNGEWGNRQLGAIGLPIRRRNGRAVASMSLLYARRTVGASVIENEFLPALLRSVAAIEAQL